MGFISGLVLVACRCAPYLIFPKYCRTYILNGHIAKQVPQTRLFFTDDDNRSSGFVKKQTKSSGG
jgi:hypothetical protein